MKFVLVFLSLPAAVSFLLNTNNFVAKKDTNAGICSFGRWQMCLSGTTSKTLPTNPLVGTGNILLLDHLNINHEAGRHDLLKSFYFEILGCSIDPRKEENLIRGKKTLWANVGINQFHLPEETEPQVFSYQCYSCSPNTKLIRDPGTGRKNRAVIRTRRTLSA